MTEKIKIRAYVEETYQHLMEFEIPEDGIDYFDYQDEVQRAYEEGRAVPGQGKLMYMQVNDEDASSDWKELWLKHDKNNKLPVVKVPDRVPGKRQVVCRLLVTAPSDFTDEDISLELTTRLLSADGGHHLETMNWGPDERVKIKVLKN